MNRELPPHVVERAAIVYVRQSTGAQVKDSKRYTKPILKPPGPEPREYLATARS
jgi:hypothetical protein